MHPLTRPDVDNAPDQNPTIHCEHDQCSHTVEAREAETDDWLLKADSDIPVLCPACQEVVPRHRLVPADDRRERNQSLAQF